MANEKQFKRGYQQPNLCTNKNVSLGAAWYDRIGRALNSWGKFRHNIQAWQGLCSSHIFHDGIILNP